MDAGYSSKSLRYKLGIKSGLKIVVIWVSWPKKTAAKQLGIATDLTEDRIRNIALPLGLVDVKVCAVDETWSGLKLVIRKKLR